MDTAWIGLSSNDLEPKPLIGASGCYQLATTCQLVTTPLPVVKWLLVIAAPFERSWFQH